MSGTLKAWRNATLRFGLVAVPVSLVPAKDADKLSRHRYDRESGTRVRQAWTADGENIAAETFLAYDVGGTAVEIEVPDDGSDKGIRLAAFVSEGTIDPLFYDDAYILFAGKDGADGLGVLAGVLRENVYMMFAGEARFTDRTRSVVVRWSDAAGCLVLHTLTFASRVRFESFRIAAESLATPDDALRKQGTMFADTLPDTFVPSDSDPLEAAILSALREASPAAVRGSVPAASISAGDILETLRADVQNRADVGTRKGTKSARAKSSGAKSKT